MYGMGDLVRGAWFGVSRCGSRDVGLAIGLGESGSWRKTSAISSARLDSTRLAHAYGVNISHTHTSVLLESKAFVKSCVCVCVHVEMLVSLIWYRSE